MSSFDIGFVKPIPDSGIKKGDKLNFVTNLNTRGKGVTLGTPLRNLIAASVIDSNCVTGNIKSGITIDGVSGTTSVVDTATATATSSKILTGYSAYVNGTLLNGSAVDATGMKRVAVGQVTSNGSFVVTVTGLAFTPGIVILVSTASDGKNSLNVCANASIYGGSMTSGVNLQVSASNTATLAGLNFTATGFNGNASATNTTYNYVAIEA